MKKVTFLFGAGAALPWEAPHTKDITEAINNSDDYLINGKTLGIWINGLLTKLSQTQPPNPSINFETYVDFLESVYAYLVEVDPSVNKFYSGSLYRIFELKDEVMKGIQKLESNGSSFNSNPDKIRLCFYSLIRIIRNQINKYLENYGNTALDVNKKLRYFCEHFMKNGYSVRSYTINYDRSIPLVFESVNSKYEIFDGFDIQNHSVDMTKNDLYFPNKSRILTDAECHSFYNLHGSFHWEFQDCDYKTTNHDSPFTIMSTKKRNPHNSAHIEEYPINSNPNEKLLQCPIITGYKKVQRINIEPFNYFFHSFFNDIHQSEIIIIVGYSFSDPHINQLLIDARRRKVRIYNITYKEDRLINNGKMTSWGRILTNHYPAHTKWFSDSEFFYLEYPNGFEKFLSDEEWFNIQPM